MKLRLILLLSLFLAAACSRPKEIRSSSIPDNVVEDKPIVLKEGQAILIVPESDKSLMIAVAVTDGKLSLAELSSGERTVGINWSSQDSWMTSTTIKKDGSMTTIIDEDGNGIPDIQAVASDGSIERYRFSEPSLIPFETMKKANKAEMATPRKPSD